MKEAEFLLLRSMKGAPMACLMALGWAGQEGQPVSQACLVSMVGYSTKPVREALRTLKMLGWVANKGMGWELAGDGWKLPFWGIPPAQDGRAQPRQAPAAQAQPQTAQGPFPTAEEFRPEEALDEPGEPDAGDCLDQAGEDLSMPAIEPQPAREAPDENGGTEDGEGISPTPLDSALVVSSSSRSSLKIPERELLLTTTRATSRKKPAARVSKQEWFEQNLAECDAQGIFEPARSVISMRPNVTPEYIRYHCQNAPNLSMAVYRMQKGWRIKTEPEQGGTSYINGQYADFIQH